MISWSTLLGEPSARINARLANFHPKIPCLVCQNMNVYRLVSRCSGNVLLFSAGNSNSALTNLKMQRQGLVATLLSKLLLVVPVIRTTASFLAEQTVEKGQPRDFHSKLTFSIPIANLQTIFEVLQRPVGVRFSGELRLFGKSEGYQWTFIQDSRRSSL